MNSTNKQTVAVIGGGVIGLNSAYQLQKNGFDVTIFDGNDLASDASASYGNAGHFATEQVFPLADVALLPQIPKMLADPLGPFKIHNNYFVKALPWFIKFMCAMRPKARAANTSAIKALNTRSIESWQRLTLEIDAQALLILNGSLLTYEGNGECQIQKDLLHYQAQGVAVEIVMGEALATLAPNLSSGVSKALYFTQVGHTPSPALLCQKIAQSFTALGGEHVVAHVTKVTNTDSPVISTELGKRVFDKIVLCAGAHSKVFAKQLGYDVPLETERGYHLMLPVDTDLQCPVASSDRKFIMTPMDHGLRLAGTVEFAGLDNAPDHRRSEMLLTHAKAMFSSCGLPQLAELSIEQLSEQARWMGFRPSLPDSLPIIDRSPSNSSVFFNFGHQHLGLTWGALCGELIKDLVLGQSSTLDITPYRITRF